MPDCQGIGVPPQRINKIIHGKRAITADTALRLSRYFALSTTVDEPVICKWQRRNYTTPWIRSAPSPSEEGIMAVANNVV